MSRAEAFDLKRLGWILSCGGLRRLFGGERGYRDAQYD